MDVEFFFYNYLEQNVIWSESPYVNDINKNVSKIKKFLFLIIKLNLFLF
jgi:hypothetical protein